MKMVLRILLTVLWLICALPFYLIFQIYTEGSSVWYEFNNPSSVITGELESALDVSFPEDLQITQIRKGFACWSPEQEVEYRIYSNYDEAQWQQVLGAEWKRTIADRTVALSCGGPDFSLFKKEEKYLRFELPAELLLYGYNQEDGYSRNDKKWNCQCTVYLLIYFLLLGIIWNPFAIVREHKERVRRAKFELPDWVKEEEAKEQAEK